MTSTESGRVRGGFEGRRVAQNDRSKEPETDRHTERSREQTRNYVVEYLKG